MNITINTEIIQLDQFLKFAGACATGGAAQVAITNGEVTVNGEVCLKKRKKLVVGDKVIYNRNEFVVCGNK
ncbi:MAG: RNA-binding S4 domain-containing protein [Oscillospiraceae bacterium]|jgi:ribosome-associated protein|nr:RNA-binding S4 domain-containing protein [Oscillospiraceae bacterium]